MQAVRDEPTQRVVVGDSLLVEGLFQGQGPGGDAIEHHLAHVEGVNLDEYPSKPRQITFCKHFGEHA